MLTRLRVQGFKNLLDIDVRFGPFTCIAGPNGAGKSNLFDAIRFLHLLAQYPIMQAVQMLRETKGRSPEPRSLFTTFHEYTAPEMRFTAELIVDRSVQDDFGVSAEAAISTLAYEVAFALRNDDGVERLVLINEALYPIPQTRAKVNLGFPHTPQFVRSCIKGRRPAPFVTTTTKDGEPEVKVHQDGHGGRTLPAPKSIRTVVGGSASSEYPTVLAVNREMISWKTLLLEPSAMRASSSYHDPRAVDSRGANLPATIQRLEKEEQAKGAACAELAARLAELIEDVQTVRLRDDPKTETYTIEVSGRDGVFHPARSLSDGTLRFLVLATLAQDPQTAGVICLEEPENGIHPDRIPAMVRLLKDIAVDPNCAIGPDNSPRQVIVNTHSPEVFQNVSPTEDLIYIEESSIILGGTPCPVATIAVPKGSWRSVTKTQKVRTLAPGRVRSYLGEAAPSEQRQLWLKHVEGGLSR